MIDWFLSGGFIMWPILAVALGVVWIAIATAIRMRRPDASPQRVHRGLHAVLFWGGMAAVLGLLGTAVGLVQAARALQHAGVSDTSLVWGGVGLTLIPLVFGLVILVAAGLAWFLLQGSHGARYAAEAGR